MKMINAGYGNYIAKDKITAIIGVESAPVTRMIKAAKEKGTLIDVTFGRKMKSAIITKDNQIIVTAVLTDALKGRMEREDE